MPERVFFAGGDPEYEDEVKPNSSDVAIKRGKKLIKVGSLMLVLGLLMCLFFIILVVGVVPASLSTCGKDGVSSDDEVHLVVGVALNTENCRKQVGRF